MKKLQWVFYIMAAFYCFSFLYPFFPVSYSFINGVHYSVVIFTFFLACKGKNLISLGLLFTVLSDFFLIFTEYYALGILLFCCTHITYLSYQRNQQIKLYTVPVYFLFFPALAYAFLLLSNFLLAYKNYKRHRNPSCTLFLIGILLLIFCDITTVLSYLTGNAFLSWLIWIFYVPSLFAIGLSANRSYLTAISK